MAVGELTHGVGSRVGGLLLAFLAAWSVVANGAPGLTGEYYDNNDFTSLKFTRTDAVVNFNYGTGSPSNSLAADTFSIRWSGQIEPPFSETYTFYVTADDGARLWVNDRLVVARTSYSLAALEMTGQLRLEAGQRYNLVLEFVENTGGARVALEWSSPSLPREVIPATRLFTATAVPERGVISAEYWMNTAGTNLQALTTLAGFPDRPDSRDQLPLMECLQPDWADNYGTRVTGFLVPPTTGSYQFAVASASAAALFISDTTNAVTRRLIASNTFPAGFRQFEARAEQVSQPISLQAHQKYYVELLHKAGTGADHFSVAWRKAGDPAFTVIPGSALVPGGSERSAPAQASFLDTLAAGHPRLLASPSRFVWLRNSVASNSIPQLSSWWQSYSNSATAVLAQPLSVYDPDVRGTILATSRAVMDRMYKLATVWRMNGNTNFAERAWQELEQVASTNFPDWHPAHFLDTAEMTHACAIGYDWLYEYWTPERRTVIRNSIINKGLKQSLTLYTNNSSWVASGANNWNLVCNGGMVIGALAVADENQAMSRYILSKALPSAGAVMRHYTTDNGGWYEGPGYWDYTTDYNIRLIAGLESALGSDFGLNRVKAFAETGLNPIYMVGPVKLSFNYADAGAGNMRGAQMFYLGRRFHRPEFSWYERNNASVDALDLLWYDASGADPRTSELPVDNCFRGPTGAAPYYTADAVTLRTRWQDSRATFVGFKAGEIGASHGNLDAGSFVLDALGVRWAHDLGGDDYALPGYFSEPQRWTYYRLRAEGHNTLVINPASSADQVVDALPPMILFASDSERSVAVADLTKASPAVGKHWRGIRLFQKRRWVMVQDEVTIASPARLWWFMHIHTNTTAVIDPSGAAVMLTQGSERLWITNLLGVGTFTISNAVPLATSPNPAGQNANSNYRKLAMQLTNVTSRTLSLLMVPLSPGESLPTNLPPVVALSDWGVAGFSSEVSLTNSPPSAAATNFFIQAPAPVLVDLRSLGTDKETPASNLVFSVSGATNGTVSLLADGFTARFVPYASFAGSGGFAYSVADAWPDSRLVAAYDFEPPEEVADGFVSDLTANAFYGELTVVGTGTNYLVNDVPPSLTNRSTRALVLREAGDFNGARLKSPIREADLDFNNQSWTVALWFKRAASSNDDFLFYVGTSDGFGSPDELQLYGPGGQTQLGLRHYIGTSATDADLVAANVRVGEWRHAAVVFNPTNGNPGSLSLYLDGALVGTDDSVALNMASGKLAYFAGHGSQTFAVTRWFNGRLDDVGIFGAALSAGDISRLTTRPIIYLGGAAATNTVRISIPARPLLTAPQVAGGALTFTVSGDPGYTYAVQASTNLIDWSTVQITSEPAMPVIFNDSSLTNAPARFYRVILSP